jgi:SRSO17 transposase
MDAGYGKTPWLLRALDQDGETFVADVQKNQRIYLEDPMPQPVQRKTKDGKVGTRMQTKAEAIRVDSWAKAQPEQAWKTITLRDANRGPLRVKSLHQKVWLWNGEEPKAQGWQLIVRQELNHRETIKYTLSNAPDNTAHERLATMQASRFFVERSLQDAKSTCGMDQYQLRKWQGFHHHMAMIMIAMLFLLGERIHQQDAKPLLSCADVFNLLKFHLPAKAITEKDIWQQIARSHRQRQAVIDAAHRKQIMQLE